MDTTDTPDTLYICRAWDIMRRLPLFDRILIHPGDQIFFTDSPQLAAAWTRRVKIAALDMATDRIVMHSQRFSSFVDAVEGLFKIHDDLSCVLRSAAWVLHCFGHVAAPFKVCTN